MVMEVRLLMTDNDQKKFEQWLSENGKHYYDLAEHLRLSRSYINQVFSGLVTISLERLQEIEKWCGLEFEVEHDERDDLGAK